MLLASELVIAAFDQGHEDPLLLIKGGVAIEMRLRLRGRATKDIDATLVIDGDMEAVEAIVARVWGHRFSMVPCDSMSEVLGIKRSRSGSAFRRCGKSMCSRNSPWTYPPGRLGSRARIATISRCSASGALGIDHGTDVAKCLALRFQIA